MRNENYLHIDFLNKNIFIKMKTKQLPEFPNYTIFEDGTIYNQKRCKVVNPYPLKQIGYYIVSLSNNGLRKQFYLHRLLAICFLENPNGLPEVDHIDGDKTNNNISNLRWISRLDNKRCKRKRCGKNELSSVPYKQRLRMKKYMLKVKLNKLFENNDFTAESIKRMIEIKRKINELTSQMKLMVNPKYKNKI